MRRPGNLAGVTCDVRGCDRAGIFTLTRTMRGDHHPTVFTLRYCPEHYAAANRFNLQRTTKSLTVDHFEQSWT